MKRTPRPRKTADLSDSLHRQLSMYTLVASAAGVTLLVLAQPSEAKIVYTKAYHVIRPGTTFHLDLNHDGKTDFSIRNSAHCETGGTCIFRVSAIRYGANGVEGTPGTEFTPPQAYALNAGARIGPNQPFFGMRMAGAGVTTQGNWYNVTNRYLGLKFHIKGRIHYGWARLTVELGNHGFRATLTGYAYETIPNKPIIAGKTKGTDDASRRTEQANVASPGTPAPQPASLGLLAMGSPGLSIWRRKAALDATPERN